MFFPCKNNLFEGLHQNKNLQKSLAETTNRHVRKVLRWQIALLNINFDLIYADGLDMKSHPKHWS